MEERPVNGTELPALLTEVCEKHHVKGLLFKLWEGTRQAPEVFPGDEDAPTMSARGKRRQHHATRHAVRGAALLG